MIPTTRAVIGADLEDIRVAQGLSTADACWLFGMSISRWTEIVRRGADSDVADPTLAVLVRALDKYADNVRIIPKMPTAAETFELLNAYQVIDKKRFAILTGTEASGGYRWLTQGARQPPVLQRIFFCMRQMMLSRPESERAGIIEDWAKMVEREAEERGVKDVFKKGYWNKKDQKGEAPSEVNVESAATKAPAKQAAAIPPEKKPTSGPRRIPGPRRR
jgi:hypothetical protein